MNQFKQIPIRQNICEIVLPRLELELIVVVCQFVQLVDDAFIEPTIQSVA